MRIWLHLSISGCLKDTPKSRLNIGNTYHLLFQKNNCYCSCSAALEKKKNKKELARMILVLFIVQHINFKDP